MNKTQKVEHISSKYYRAGSTYLSEEAIKEIKDLSGKGPNVVYAMAKKYHILERLLSDFKIYSQVFN